MRKIVITGAAGLVGQNFVARLKSRPDLELVGIDKHEANVRLFRDVHPGVQMIEADLAQPGKWAECFAGESGGIPNQQRHCDKRNSRCNTNPWRALFRWGVVIGRQFVR